MHTLTALTTKGYALDMRGTENLNEQEAREILMSKYLEAVNKLGELETKIEQGRLIELPCKVDDTVYYLDDLYEKQGRKKVNGPFVNSGIVDHITIGETMIPQIDICNAENVWTTYSRDDFGKTIFLTKEAAEAALKECEKK